ncbi:hypothetical protein [Paenibacillus lemnae]|uniref:Type II secretion system protein n=1 Tax=Paenibacillus lemnae TaxID=1330551 RepID=A0A848M6Y2_PAELE|nr:hypothetical protein [Paenibacillus lemnae]NMO95950.1 hypothetical protein [Paenibacillus lemnae]
MKNAAVSMLELAAAAALFLSACVMAYSLQQDISMAQKAVYGVLEDQHVSITTQVYQNSPQQLRVSSADLLYFIHSSQHRTYPVKIHDEWYGAGIVIPPEVIFDHLPSFYQVQYQYNSAGEIAAAAYIKEK